MPISKIPGKGTQNLFNNISDEDLKKMRDAKLFAMESSGELGGTFGAEIEANKAKFRFAKAIRSSAREIRSRDK